MGFKVTGTCCLRDLSGGVWRHIVTVFTIKGLQSMDNCTFEGVIDNLKEVSEAASIDPCGDKKRVSFADDKPTIVIP
jgi:hypothetical protein